MQRPDRLFKPLLWFSLSLIAGLMIAAPALAQAGGGLNPQAWLLNALQWIDGLGFVGGLALMVIYIVATVAFLPGSILTLGGGSFLASPWGR
jgi:uncharacterized membrane protein YdjX (TVP38/TMEM64 family)